MDGNNLGALNDILFRQLDRIENTKTEDLASEIDRARTVKGLADTVISNGNLMLNAARASIGTAEAVHVPRELMGGNRHA